MYLINTDFKFQVKYINALKDMHSGMYHGDVKKYQKYQDVIVVLERYYQNLQ